jgi:hypothetical protein
VCEPSERLDTEAVLVELADDIQAGALRLTDPRV